MRKKVIIISSITAAIFIITGIVIGGFIKANNITKNNKDIFYIVPKDASIEKIADDLRIKGVIQNKSFFIYKAKANELNNNINNNNIIIKPKIALKELMDKLKSSQPDFAIVTIPEGFTLYQIGERLEKNKLVDKKSFIDINLKDLDSTNMITPRKDIIHDMEGFLFPDTYYIPLGLSEKEVASMMFNRFKAIFPEEYVERAKELGLSINDVITVASLIEKEAENDSERSKIAGVIYNRLKKGMLLQIDAAVIYANTKGEKHLQRVLYSDLKIDSKYNTYKYKQLPPGPIASPGRPSIKAALYPESHDYLYYVAGESGHVFSKTYEEHMENVKKYIK